MKRIAKGLSKFFLYSEVSLYIEVFFTFFTTSGRGKKNRSLYREDFVTKRFVILRFHCRNNRRFILKGQCKHFYGIIKFRVNNTGTFSVKPLIN